LSETLIRASLLGVLAWPFIYDFDPAWLKQE
jgi:hypothetical protein